MVIIRLWGGIGNQLFQYSFGCYLKEKIGIEVAFDTASFGTSDQLRKLEITSIVSDIRLKDVCFTKYKGLLNRILRIGFQCKNTYLLESNFNIDKLAKMPGNIFLQGYWQEEMYAKSFPTKIVLDSWKSPKSLDNILKSILSTENSIALHIRRGDYFSPKNIGIYGVCTEKYYQCAIDHVEAKIQGNKQYFVFSDDVLWVREHITLPENTIIVPNYPIPQFSYIYLMSLCRINIISNSSFSWWGAYLNQYKDKLVITPSRWFLTSNKTLALNDWLKIPV